MDPEQTRNYYQQSRAARWTALATISVCYILSAMTLSSTHVAIPAIGEDLHASALLLSWIPTAYLLTNVVLLLPFGRLADTYGRRRVFLLGVVLLTLGTLLAGLAPAIGWLLAARVVQGIGGAMLFACGMAIVLSTFPVHFRGTAIGIISGSAYLGLTGGPLVGGFLTEFAGWRSVFLVQVPLGLAVTVLIVAKLKGEWRSTVVQPFDWRGSAALAVWALSLSIGFSLVPGLPGLSLVVLGVLVLAYFIRHLARAPHPLVDVRAVRANRDFFRAITNAALMYASAYPLVFLLSLYLQYILGKSPAQAGSIMFVQAMVMAFMSPISGRLADRHNPQSIAAAGSFCVACGFAVLAAAGFNTPALHILAGLLLIGVGMGLFSTPNNSAGLSAVSANRLGESSALINLSRNFGNIWSTVLVLLFISLFLGGEKIQPAQYGTLLWVTRLLFGLSCLYALFACWLNIGSRRSVSSPAGAE